MDYLKVDIEEIEGILNVYVNKCPINNIAPGSPFWTLQEKVIYEYIGNDPIEYVYSNLNDILINKYSTTNIEYKLVYKK